MKKFIKPVVFGVIFITCLFVINTGCKKKATCSASEPLCGSHTFQACCTETDCYYLVDGEDKFNCNGTRLRRRRLPVGLDILRLCGQFFRETAHQDH